MTLTLLTIAAAFGACLGSFANVLIHRLPRNEGVVRGRSNCPGCGHTIAWYDNLPLVSWLVLRGRCRACAARISWRYPAVEFAGAALAVGCTVGFGPTPTAAWVFAFVSLLLVIALVDWQHMIIPHTLTVTGIVLGLGFAPWCGPGLGASLLGILVGGGTVLALSEGYRLVRGEAGMGGGDVVLMAMIGAFLGPWAAAAVLGTGALLGTLYVMIKSGGRLAGTTRLPFGTFLAAGAAAVLFWGEAIWIWYLGVLS